MTVRALYPELDDDTCWTCLAPITGVPIRTCNTTVCSEDCRIAAEEAMTPIGVTERFDRG